MTIIYYPKQLESEHWVQLRVSAINRFLAYSQLHK